MVATDLLVIGGGPAGLAAAIAARQVGLSVRVVEKRHPPVDKACGEGVMPEGAAALRRLGVRLPAGRFAEFHGIRYVESRGSASRIEAVARFRGAPGIGTPRAALHEAMARRAAEAGVALHWGTAFERLHPEGAVVDGHRVTARFVAGADGQGSRVRRELGLERPPESRRLGQRRRYRIRPWSAMVEVHWSDEGEAYVTPVGPEEVSVALLSDGAPREFDSALTAFPVLAQRLASAEPSSGEVTAPSLFRKGAQVTSGRVALVGDAAGSVDAMTGEGITLGLLEAEALALSLHGGSLAPYARAQARIVRRPNRMTGLMLSIKRRPRLRHLVLRGLASAPGLFDTLLARHTRPLRAA